mmetsp:Transcript_71960/g.114080  ORF Transcript_71960/g.114080 Transcript_71960/m.114080 type:complete len:255 (+) Transcript_71960:431-1195(+)
MVSRCTCPMKQQGQQQVFIHALHFPCSPLPACSAIFGAAERMKHGAQRQPQQQPPQQPIGQEAFSISSLSFMYPFILPVIQQGHRKVWQHKHGPLGLVQQAHNPVDHTGRGLSSRGFSARSLFCFLGFSLSFLPPFLSSAFSLSSPISTCSGAEAKLSCDFNEASTSAASFAASAALATKSSSSFFARSSASCSSCFIFSTSFFCSEFSFFTFSSCFLAFSKSLAFFSFSFCNFLFSASSLSLASFAVATSSSA